MPDIEPLLSLPTETLLVLALGFLGYQIAYQGQDQKHKPLNITFISLAFGLIAKLSFASVQPVVGDKLLAVATACSVTFVAAAVWRRWGQGLVKYILRKGNISFSDGHRSVWDAIRLASEDRPTQIVVWQRSGGALMCDYLKNFEHLPHGPCCYGEDGSVV